MGWRCRAYGCNSDDANWLGQGRTIAAPMPVLSAGQAAGREHRWCSPKRRRLRWPRLVITVRCLPAWHPPVWPRSRWWISQELSPGGAASHASVLELLDSCLTELWAARTVSEPLLRSLMKHNGWRRPILGLYDADYRRRTSATRAGPLSFGSATSRARRRLPAARNWCYGAGAIANSTAARAGLKANTHRLNANLWLPLEFHA